MLVVKQFRLRSGRAMKIQKFLELVHGNHEDRLRTSRVHHLRSWTFTVPQEMSTYLCRKMKVMFFYGEYLAGGTFTFRSQLVNESYVFS